MIIFFTGNLIFINVYLVNNIFFVFLGAFLTLFYLNILFTKSIHLISTGYFWSFLVCDDNNELNIDFNKGSLTKKYIKNNIIYN